MKIMAFSPITSWQIDGETMETVTDFIFLGSKITEDSDCSHEIKTLAPWKNSSDKPRQRIKKQRYNFANKDLSSQSYWRRKWQPTPVLLPGISHGEKSLVGCSPWGR